MQTVGGAVIPDIAGDAALAEPLVERVEIGALMDKAAFAGGRQESGTGGRHGAVI
jgi:hypothetical protein